MTPVITCKKKLTIFDHCEAIIQTLPWARKDYIINPDIVERTQVVQAIITYANHHRMALHSIQVMNWYDVVMSGVIPERYSRMCVDLINRRHKFF